MRTHLTDEQKTLLAARRNEVVGRLFAVGDPCPGCIKGISTDDAEFHHIPWRQSDSFTFDTDLMLLDPANGVLAHHACHMREGWDFQVRAALLLWHRVGTGQLRKFKAKVEKEQVVELAWPRFLWAVMDTMAHNSSRQYCPSCYGYHLHEFRNPPGRVGAPVNSGDPLRVKAICWNCLSLFPAGSILNGG